MRITTVLFDLGGTLEDSIIDFDSQKKCIETIQKILCNYSSSFDIDQNDFSQQLLDGAKAYKKWSTETRVEAPSHVIWGDWFLRNFHDEKSLFLVLADMLTDLWESRYYVRRLKPDAKELLTQLHEKGYRMGIISNTTSRQMSERYLEYYGISDFFDIEIYSAREGIRKPDTRLFKIATEALGVSSKECIYVGDQIEKDIRGAYEAGFAYSALIPSYLTDMSKIGDLKTSVLGSLMDLIPVLDGINQ